MSNNKFCFGAVSVVLLLSTLFFCSEVLAQDSDSVNKFMITMPNGYIYTGLINSQGKVQSRNVVYPRKIIDIQDGIPESDMKNMNYRLENYCTSENDCRGDTAISLQDGVLWKKNNIAIYPDGRLTVHYSEQNMASSGVKDRGELVLPWVKGYKYLGELRDGKMEGYGMLILYEQVVYEGLFKNDKIGLGETGKFILLKNNWRDPSKVEIDPERDA
ncbi:MAG: hypothetical protein LBB24_01575, partial [Rickettsiales bacterium]|nr:hypothetical protein [Rickettsiales bacterium]